MTAISVSIRDETQAILNQVSKGDPAALASQILDLWAQAKSVEEYRADRAALEEEERRIDDMMSKP